MSCRQPPSARHVRLDAGPTPEVTRSGSTSGDVPAAPATLDARRGPRTARGPRAASRAHRRDRRREPCARRQHQRVLQRLQVGLLAATPPECETLPGVNVVLNGERLLIPDLVVTTNPGADAVYFDATDILMAAEVLSPSSRAFDRALKRQLYAEAAIPFFVIVDPVAEPVSAIAYEFDGAGYREMARSDDGVLKWERPFPVLVDLQR
ncbi:Uma2 family endonuclease [Allokutzneria albata]|nr:Uma2 family endonuclease [Allokutzneria albata]